MTKTNYTKKAIHGTMIVFIFSLVAALFAYLFRLLLAKNLSLAEFGLFSAIVAFGGFLMVFRDLGVGQAAYYFIPRFLVQKRKDKLKGLISNILKLEFITSFLIATFMIIFSDYLVQNYFHAGTSAILILFAIGFFFNSIELNFQNFFAAFQNQLLFSTQNLARAVLIFLLTLIGFCYFKNLYIPVIASLIAYVLILIFFSILFFKKIFPDYFVVEKNHKLKFMTLVSFGVSAMFVNLGYLLLLYTDTLMLTLYRSLEEVGLYNAAVPIITLLLYVPLAACVVILPLSSELWSRKKIELLRLAVNNITKYIFIVLIPLAGILIIFPEIVLNLLFGAKFIPASSALMILAAGTIFFSIGLINIHFLLGIFKPKINMYIYGSAAIINILLNALFIPKYGISGAALGTVISQFSIFLISSIVLYKKINLRLDFLKYLLTFISGGIFVILVLFLKKLIILPLFIELFIVIGISAIIYGLFLFLFRVITIDEIKDTVQKLIKK